MTRIGTYALMFLVCWLGSPTGVAAAVEDQHVALLPLADERIVPSARMRHEIPITLEDDRVQMVFQPEFRPAADLAEALKRFAIPDVEVKLTTPRVVVNPSIAVGRKGREGFHRVLISAARKASAYAAFDALRTLDIPPRQVSVSLMICEVWHDKRGQSGGSLFFDRDPVSRPHGLFRGVGMTFDPDDYLRSTITGARPFEGTTLGFAEGHVEGSAFEYALRALQKEGDARFVAWPSLICTEGVPATLDSIRRIPQLLFRAPSPNEAVFTSHEELGLKVRIVPVRIGSDSATIELDLWMRLPQESEDANAAVGTLELRSRQVRTRLTVRDGLTVIFGGVRVRGRSRNRRGLPGLGAVSPVDALLSARAQGAEVAELCFALRVRMMTPARDHLSRATPFTRSDVDEKPNVVVLQAAPRKLPMHGVESVETLPTDLAVRQPGTPRSVHRYTPKPRALPPPIIRRKKARR